MTNPPPTVTTKNDPIRTIAFVSLGCPKNLVDSEKMLGLLSEDGIVPIDDEAQADAIVINTCGFLEASKEESIEEINHAVALKKEGKCKRVIVAGCLVQRHRAKILDWCPDVDAMVGVFDRDHIVKAVRGQGAIQKDVGIDLPIYSSIATNATIAKQHRGITEEGYFESDSARLRLTPRHYAYLRISEGCNQNCTFCTIPSIRGKMRSKPADRVIAEANELFSDGAFELNLIGQDTTSYGNDIGYTASLSGLLKSLNTAAQNNGGAWLRLMYAYPSCFTDEMIQAIAQMDHVVKYIDMPLQHINDQVLDNMRRKTSRKLIETLLAKLRDRIPEMVIRTTFISGYPGETEDQHKELVDFVGEFGFEAMGVFPYSREPGTVAGTQYDQGGAVDPDVVSRRIEQLMLTQQQVAFNRNESWLNQAKVLDILIDQDTGDEVQPTTDMPSGGKLYEGRGKHQAPQVDSLSYVISQETLSPGQVVRCQVTGVQDYDLIVQPITDLSKDVSLDIL